MTRLEQALDLAARGFWIFPCIEGDKKPAISDWPNRATRDPAQLEKWWAFNDHNIGIATEKFGDDRALVVVDVDVKGEKDGNAELFRLELEGHELPATLEQSTPSGGRHLVYVAAESCKQGVDVLGIGLDVRSRGGYIVGAGSCLNGKPYELHEAPLATAPQWLVHRLGVDRSVRAVDRTPVAGVDAGRAVKRALKYLETAPVAKEGEGGDLATYKVAAKLKDFGLEAAVAFDLMLGNWNPRCEPPWPAEELAVKVDHAFKYGKEAPGIDAPEAVFAAAPAATPADTGTHPFDKLNGEFAFVKRGAFVLQETTDERGTRAVEHLNMAEFHGWFANVPFQVGKKTLPISQWWLEWPQRRQYEGVVFMPQQDAGPRWYNMWTGFSVAPTSGGHPAVQAFLDHALHNVCGGDNDLYRWLVGYFAHMIQRPWEKPLVALVFKGKKGTGKNALVERVGHLLGSHFMVADDDRYLLSNFNAHFESNLFLVLDEAAWAGDKRAEGRLKGLITGKHHNIERKGKEVYRVDNLTRVAIIGNETWLVPASQDERRFAVFNVGDGRKQDRKFFQEMREGMERGGYPHLLQFLMDYDLSGVDVNDAPATKGLVEQKHASLDPLPEWWLNCLVAQEIIGADFGGEWPEAVATNRLRDAFRRWATSRNIRGRLPDEKEFGKVLRTVAPSMVKKKARPDNTGDSTYSYFNPGVDALRQDWERHIGGEVSWDEC
jgi:hypothetical protein